jgi:hypothetical protein
MAGSVHPGFNVMLSEEGGRMFPRQSDASSVQMASYVNLVTASVFGPATEQPGRCGRKRMQRPPPPPIAIAWLAIATKEDAKSRAVRQAGIMLVRCPGLTKKSNQTGCSRWFEGRAVGRLGLGLGAGCFGARGRTSASRAMNDNVKGRS